VNRAERRRRQRSGRRMLALRDKVERTGQAGHIVGMTHACRDCTADGALTLLPGRIVLASIYHDPHCPAAARPLDTHATVQRHRLETSGRRGRRRRIARSSRDCVAPSFVP
jgi:hypothetical protein